MKFPDRPTSEVLIIAITFTVCGYIIVNAVLIVIVGLFTERDLAGPARNLADIINTLIGLLAGYLAGRSGMPTGKSKKKDDDDPGL